MDTSTTPTSSLRSRNSRLLLSAPSTDTVPPSRSMASMMSRMVVLLPAPFSPTRPSTQP